MIALPVLEVDVTSWPREGVVLLILIAVVLVGVTIVVNLRGTPLSGGDDRLDLPELPTDAEPRQAIATPTAADAVDEPVLHEI